MAGLMARTKKPLWGTWKMVVMDIRLCVHEGLISMVEKGVLGSELIKKRCYCPRGCQQRRFFGTCKKRRLGMWTQFRVQ